MRIVLLICLVFVVQTSSQTADKFAVYDGKGNPSSIEAIVNSLGNVDVVFLGELHDDAIGHQVELEIFKQAVEKYLASRRVTLSLEMFERDVQIVLDEYLAGLITEEQFLRASRPWPRYKDDYRPLVELAKEKKLYVIAANAPRRYVNMVSRNGRQSLSTLSKDAKASLAPLPYSEPSEAYAKKFKALMASSPEASMGIDNILSSQSLWDATMAHSIARHLKKNKRALVVHLNGGFHTENRLGTVEHLLRYRKKAKALVVTMRNADDLKVFDKAKHTDLGDFVILTAPKPKVHAVVLGDIFHRMKLYWASAASLRALIVMTRHNAQLNETDAYEGHVVYARGRRSEPLFRVDWTKPGRETFLTKGGQYLLYRESLNQAMMGRFSDQQGNWAAASVFTLLSTTPETFKANFNAALLGEEAIDKDVRTWHLRVIPKNPTLFKVADLWIDANGMVRKAAIREPNGDTMSVQLSDISANTKVDPAEFSLKLPKNVKVIRF